MGLIKSFMAGRYNYIFMRDDKILLPSPASLTGTKQNPRPFPSEGVFYPARPEIYSVFFFVNVCVA